MKESICYYYATFRLNLLNLSSPPSLNHYTFFKSLHLFKSHMWFKNILSVSGWISFVVMEQIARQKTTEMMFEFRQLKQFASHNAHTIDAEDSFTLSNIACFKAKWDGITLICCWASSTVSHQSFLILPSTLSNLRKRHH